MTAPAIPDGLEPLLAGLTPWQRRMLDATLDPGFRGFTPSPARRVGLSTVNRLRAMVSAAQGKHVHSVQPDGTWCVTRQPVGFLWARMPAARHARPFDPVTGLRR